MHAAIGTHARSPADKPLTVSAPDVAPTASALRNVASTTAASASHSKAWRRRSNGSVQWPPTANRK